MFYKSLYKSPLGNITIACDENSIIGLWIEGQKHFGKTLPTKFTVNDNHSVLQATKKWLDEYFAGKCPNINKLSLSPAGTAFQKEVWEILKNIPYGETITYGEIAKIFAEKYGREKFSAQAVGGAVGKNQISIIIPCHRVIGTNGSLTGYAGGLDKKIKLLNHEKIKLKL